MCTATKDGFICTRAGKNGKRHEGRHMARGINGVILKIWASAPKRKA